MDCNSHIRKIDIIKGIAIVLVVAGHSGFPDLRWMYLYHVQIFVIVAGFTYKREHAECISEVTSYIIKQTKTLLFPWFIIGTFLIALNNSLLSLRLLSVRTGDNYFSLLDALQHFVDLISFKSIHKLAGPAWFLPTLFATKCIILFLDFITRKVKKNNFTMIFVFSFALFFISAWQALRGHIMSGWGSSYNVVGICTFLFSAGMLIAKTMPRALQDLQIGCSPLFKLLFGGSVLYILIRMGCSITFVSASFDDGGVLLIASFSGYCMIDGIAEMIDRESGIIANFIAYVGTHSMVILLLHIICMKLVILLQILFLNGDMDNLSCFPYWVSGNAWWWVYCFGGIALPLSIMKCYQMCIDTLKSNKKSEKGGS